MKTKRKTVLSRLIGLFMLILLPIIAIGFGAILIVNQRSSSEVLQSISANTIQYAELFDADAMRTYETAASMMDQARIRRLANPRYIQNSHDYITDINVVRDQLTNIKLSNPSLHNVRVYFTRRSKIVNANNYLYGSIQEMDAERYEWLKKLSSLPHALLWHENRLFMLAFSHIENPTIAVEVEYSIVKMREQFETHLLYNDTDYMFFQPEQNGYMGSSEDVAFISLVKDTLANQNAVERISHNGKSYYVFWAAMPYLGALWCQIIPMEILNQPMVTSQIFVMAFTGIVLVGIALFFIGAFRIIHRPMKSLVQAFEEIRHEDFSTRVINVDTGEFEYLYQSFNDMAERLERLIQQGYRQKLLLQRAELKQLQAQINPHFLYNSFFLLRNMIEENMMEESRDVADHLGTHFEYITRSHSDMVRFRDEYQHALMYIRIQEKRFTDRICVDVQPLPEIIADCMVPKLILQPIVENAYNYGMENKAADGLLRLAFEIEQQMLTIRIEDNGEELTDTKLQELVENLSLADAPDTSKEVTGLMNIYRRLSICYQQDDVMEVTRSGLGGLSVTLRLYLRELEGM